MRAVACVSVTLVVGACTAGGDEGSGGSGEASPPRKQVKIAFLEDLSVEGSDDRVLPAFQGAALAFDRAALTGDLPVEIELVAVDTGGDPETATRVVEEAAADPELVGGIVAPFLFEQGSTGAILVEAGIPTISLSTLNTGLSTQGWSTWFTAVADRSRQAGELTSFIRGLPVARRGVCVSGDGGMTSNGMVRAVASDLERLVVLRQRLGPDDEPSSLAASVRRAGCGVVFWGGFSDRAAEIRLELDRAGSERVILVGADGIKDETYLESAGAAGEGTIVACSCADLVTAAELAAQRFIQDYQFEHGSPPGAYAAEGWDAARMFVAAFRSGGSGRAEITEFLDSLTGFEGLANTYTFGDDGKLDDASALVHLYRDEGGRWIPLAG
ncbi:MAG: branched-chain amino acid ABC transporter substrate-binding protein [Actinomycetota bacterium]